MAHIKLKQLIVSGDNVKTSSIEFGNKLTIIAGPSNTGKTYIYKCIDYILGANNDPKNPPLDLAEGYDTIKLIIETKKGLIHLTRKLLSNITVVNTDIDGIESGEYLLKEKKNNNKTINKLILKLIGAPDDLKLPKNKKGDYASFTWRTIKQAFMVDEVDSDKTESILIQRYNQTLFFASLIYLLTDDELPEYKNDTEARKIRKAKKDALLEYIKGQRSSLEEKRILLEKKLQTQKSDKTLEEQANELYAQINEIDTSITEARIKSQELTKLLAVVQNRLSRNVTTMSRYDELKSQYDTDIGRLTFIVENELLINNKDKNTKCPFCENNIESHDHYSYIEASQAELVKLVNNLNELENTKVELKNKIDDDNALIIDYKEQIDELNSIINKELIPQSNQLMKLIEDYEEKFHIELLLKNINEYDDSFEKDIVKYEHEDEIELKPFEAKQMVYNLLRDSFINHSKYLLEQMNYLPLNSVDFDAKTLDLVINGKYKNTHGKGYKSFFNSIMALTLMNHISEHSNKNLGFYIYDSPLKSLKEAEQIDHAESIRVGYFNYLSKLKTENQLIVIENTDNHELPKVEENDDIKIYKFTQLENKGRYGFLKDVKRK